MAAKIRMLIQESPNRRYLKYWEFRASLLEGKTDLLLHRDGEAQPLLSAAVDLGAEVLDVANSPALADAQLALAECWLALGQRSRAAPLLAAAESIHARHSRLGEHYKASLRRVKSRLAAGAN